MQSRHGTDSGAPVTVSSHHRPAYPVGRRRTGGCPIWPAEDENVIPAEDAHAGTGTWPCIPRHLLARLLGGVPFSSMKAS